MKALQIIGIVLLVIIAIGVAFAIEGGIIMLLWNYVLCALFPAIPTLSFGLAIGVSCILTILGGAFGVRVKTKD